MALRIEGAYGKMISRTIETVEIADKTIFYDIHIENVDFHILGHTVKTNKWLRFEEWQQIYEQLNKTLSTYPTTPLDFARKSFTVGNYIRVEIELCPIENCYGDLFNVKLDKCMPDYLLIRIKQIALGSNLEEIQQAERNHELNVALRAKRDKREAKKSKKKRRSVSLSEYDPVAVRRAPRSKYVPPYKPSKLSPDTNETEEPYSPKPVNAGESDALAVDDYSPFTISSSDNTSTPVSIPTYKPSAIVKKSSGTDGETLSNPSSENPSRDPTESTSSGHVSTKSTEYDPTKDSSTPSSSSTDMREKNSLQKHIRNKRCITPESYGSKRAKFSQDLFEDSTEEEKMHESEMKTDIESQQTLSTRTSRRNNAKSGGLDDKKTETSMPNTMPAKAKEKVNAQSSTGYAANQDPLGERRSTRTPVKTEKYDTWLAKGTTKASTSGYNRPGKSSKSKKRKLKDKKDVDLRTSTQSKSKTLSPMQELELSRLCEAPSRPIVMPTFEELRQNKVKYEQDIEMWEEVTKTLKEHIKPPPDIDVVDLNNIKTKDLIATFDEFKPQLDRYFEKYKHQKRFQSKPESEMLYLLVLEVINRDRVVSMMEHLQSVYEPNCVEMPSYTDLFMNMMAPEWIILLFMKQFKLTREKAIDRLKMQRDYVAYNQSLSMGK